MARIAELGGAGLLLFALGFAVGALVVFLLHQEHWLGGGGVHQEEAFSDVPDPQAAHLAERFRPWLEFDSREPWRPLDVSSMLDEGTHRFCTRQAGRATCIPIHNASEFASQATNAGALGPATYLDIAGEKLSDYHGPERCPPLEDCGSGPRSAIYYHVVESNDRFYVDYWWFLRFNHFARSLPKLSCRDKAAQESGVCDEHEGDWEGVTVVTPPDDDTKIDYVVYAAHKGTFRYTASQLHLEDGTRPYVYSAEGSHASYPAPCSHDCLQPSGLAADGLVDLPEGDYDGRAGWARNAEACAANAPGSCLQSLDRQPWTNWPGEWGAGCTSACGGAVVANSPRSPGLQARYQTPWCSTQNGVFTCDGRALRCGDWLGPQVAVVACDPDILAKGLSSSEAIAPGDLALSVDGKAVSRATTPGVVQALGRPLEPGATVSIVADGPSLQVLIRAEQDGVVAEDRFAGLGAEPGQKLLATVTRGATGPLVLVAGHKPVERRIFEPASSLIR